MGEKLFDLTDTSDLPPEVAAALTRGQGRFTEEILALFHEKPVLTVQEVMAGYYRSYGKFKSYEAIRMKLYTLSHKRNAPIKRTPVRGTYRLVEKGNGDA